MSTPQNPVTAAVVAYLAANVPMIEGRAYGGEMDPGEVRRQPRKAVVVRASGGDAPPTLPLRTPTFDVWCIGETKFEAERVEAAVYDALKSMQRVVVGDRLLHWAQLIGGPHSG